MHRTLAISGCVSLMFGGVAAAQTPAFHAVGVAPGRTSSAVYGLSASGGVAVGDSAGALGSVAFRWSASGGRFDLLGEPGLPPLNGAAAVAGDGSMLVGTARSSTSPAQAYRWRGAGTYEGLGVLAGWESSAALATSGDGNVVVGYCEAPLGQASVAFRWSEGTGMTPIGPGGLFSRATGISADGTRAYGWAFSGGESRAFLWTETGGTTILTSIGGPQARAYGCSADGRVAVGQAGSARALRWLDGVPMELPSPAGYLTLAASATSGDGSIVVGEMGTFNGQTLLPFVWSAGQGTQPLVSHLIANGVDIPPGWTLSKCTAVSADGFTFAGYGRAPNGTTQGFVATIPAPGVLVVAVLATFGAAHRRRRGTCVIR